MKTVIKCKKCERPISHNPKDDRMYCKRCEKIGIEEEVEEEGENDFEGTV